MSEGLKWRAALLQGAAVLVGILVAFAIDAAWETRGEQAAASAYLESLSAELDANRSAFEEYLEALGLSIERNQRFLVDLVVDGSESVTADSIRLMMTGLAPLTVVPPRRAAFDDLASGGMRTVEDAELRRLVLDYGQNLDAVGAAEQAGADWHLSQFTPYEVAEGDLVGVMSSLGRPWAGRTDIRFEFDRTAFAGNRQFANILAHYILREGFVLGARQQLLTVLVELQDALGER
jgi:hypothetical protein